MEVKLVAAATVTIFQNIYPGHINTDTVYTGNQKHKHYLHEYEAIPRLKGAFVSFYDFKILVSFREINHSESVTKKITKIRHNFLFLVYI